MKKYQISEAKARFSEIVQETPHSAAILYKHGNPVAVLVGIEEWERLQQSREASQEPSLKTLFDELAAIRTEEPDLEIPPRQKAWKQRDEVAS